MFFEREMRNPNNEKYLLKSIEYKLYILYNLWFHHHCYRQPDLANKVPRAKFHFQLPLSLVLWSYRKRISHAMCYEHGGLSQQRTEDQAFISLQLQVDQFCKSFATYIRSLSS